jgi:KaiC/GvpD/RAD55 family RecA-like ATPase
MAEDQFPGEGREIQPTVLVSGQARALLRQVPLQLLAERGEPGDGVVVVTTREDPVVVARRICGAVAAFDPARVALVDATSTTGQTPGSAEELRWSVPSPVSFEHVGAAVDAAQAELLERGADRIHFVVDALTTQFRLADAGLVHRHAYDLGMAVGAERGLGLFTLERSVTTDQEFERVRHLVDVHVAVRRTASGPQVRWSGLVGSSGGWVTLADSGLHFDALGKTIG